MTNGARHKEFCGIARVGDISIPMNGSYKIKIIDRKTREQYTIGFDVLPDATRGTPVHIRGCDVKPYRKKNQKPLLGLYERKKRLSASIEKLV